MGQLNKLWALVLLGLMACSSVVNRVHGTGHYNARVEVRIINNNWNIAKVYVRPEGFMSLGQRIATLSSNSRETISFVPTPTFEFHIVLLGDRKSSWTGFEVWQDSETCLMLEIQVHLAATQAIPCYNGKR